VACSRVNFTFTLPPGSTELVQHIKREYIKYMKCLLFRIVIQNVFSLMTTHQKGETCCTITDVCSVVTLSVTCKTAGWPILKKNSGSLRPSKEDEIIRQSVDRQN
jgi:hypothetical protein